ncbi:MAG: hypothetical protein RR712_04710 [Terrisporobacter sp.]|uniref:hypothetical protein n=1 Tax=Terrisporobacter sp. TaxID=1965305 RepID=UPI002FC5A0E0
MNKKNNITNNFKKIILPITLLIVSFFVIISISSKILNPFIGINGIIKMETGEKAVEIISEDPLRYISNTYEDFTEYMESEGLEVEQVGRGFELKSKNYVKFFMSEGFLNRYEIFTEYRKK